MKVIGLTGAAGSGKDTVAGFALDWCAENGITAERVALADPLKMSAARSLGAPVEWTAEKCVDFCNDLKQPGIEIIVLQYSEEAVEGTDVPMPTSELWTKISGRQYLQFYGTEAHRQVFGESFWTDVTKDIIDQKASEGVDIVFITDARFDDEARFVRNQDEWRGEVWRIFRDAAKPVEAHASEAGVLPALVDLLITNDGSLDDLHAAVCLVCDAQLKEEI